MPVAGQVRCFGSGAECCCSADGCFGFPSEGADQGEGVRYFLGLESQNKSHIDFCGILDAGVVAISGNGALLRKYPVYVVKHCTCQCA